MAGSLEYKQLTRARLKTAKILMDANDYDAAAYMMGYALEIALKAAACKALRLKEYPSYTKNKAIDGYFMSHKFDQLIVISGLSDIFSLSGPAVAYKNWSEFTQEYPNDWPAMRYDPTIKVRFDASKVARLYDSLYSSTDSIINMIKRNKRW